MLEKMAESSGKVIGYKAVGKISKSDFEGIEPEVKALVNKEGAIRMLWDLTGYKEETAKGLIADYKFGREFNNQIEKLAVVGDTTWEKFLTQLAKLVYARDAKFFHSADSDKAWAWVLEIKHYGHAGPKRI